jgi:splicing factor 3B subunit 3
LETSEYHFVPRLLDPHADTSNVDSQVYQFNKLGDEGDEVSSTDYPNFGAALEDLPPAFFRPHGLENLVLVDELDALSPITDSKVANVLGTDAPQIFATCGRGARSSVKMLRHGLEVDEMVSSPLGFQPNGVWAVKLKEDGEWFDFLRSAPGWSLMNKTPSTDPFDAYIVLSAANATYVLSIGESIEQVADSGLIDSARTVAIAQVGVDSILQAHTSGLLRIRSDGRKETWPEAPQTISVAAAAINKRQAVLATTSGELVYFEIGLDETLNEYMERKALGVGVTALSIAEVPEGRLRTPILVSLSLRFVDAAQLD